MIGNETSANYAPLLEMANALRDYLDILKDEIRMKAVIELGRKAPGDTVNIPDVDRENRLHNIIKELSLQTFSVYSEGLTRLEFIDPILTALGWDLSKRKHVWMERKVDVEAVADYVLYHSTGEAFAIVEAKNLYEPLGKHEAQLFGYMDASGAETGILTDGFTWWIYRKIDGGYKKVFESADILGELTPESASEMYKLIGFNANHYISKPKHVNTKPSSPLDDGWVEMI